jgi:hypothetical protein
MTNVCSHPPPTLPPSSLLAIGIAFAGIGLFGTEQHLWLRRKNLKCYVHRCSIYISALFTVFSDFSPRVEAEQSKSQPEN